MKISTRNTIKINSMNPFNNIAQNPPKQTQTKNNPYRKNWLKNIKK